MSYLCECACHCTCREKEKEMCEIRAAKKEGERSLYLISHTLNCEVYEERRNSTCCDRCKDLPEGFSFEHLCNVAPFLRCLLRQAKEFKRLAGRKPICANAIWYSTMKPILVASVGMCAHHPMPKMNGREAYDLAYKTIYEALPNCKHVDWGCWALHD